MKSKFFVTPPPPARRRLQQQKTAKEGPGRRLVLVERGGRLPTPATNDDDERRSTTTNNDRRGERRRWRPPHFLLPIRRRCGTRRTPGGLPPGRWGTAYWRGASGPLPPRGPCCVPRVGGEHGAGTQRLKRGGARREEQRSNTEEAPGQQHAFARLTVDNCAHLHIASDRGAIRLRRSVVVGGGRRTRCRTGTRARTVRARASSAPQGRRSTRPPPPAPPPAQRAVLGAAQSAATQVAARPREHSKPPQQLRNGANPSNRGQRTQGESQQGVCMGASKGAGRNVTCTQG